MQNLVGWIEIDASSSVTPVREQTGPLAVLLALAELLPETNQAAGILEYPASRLRMCSLSSPVVFGRLDVLRRELDQAWVDLQSEIEGSSTAA